MSKRLVLLACVCVLALMIPTTASGKTGYDHQMEYRRTGVRANWLSTATDGTQSSIDQFAVDEEYLRFDFAPGTVEPNPYVEQGNLALVTVTQTYPGAHGPDEVAGRIITVSADVANFPASASVESDKHLRQFRVNGVFESSFQTVYGDGSIGGIPGADQFGPVTMDLMFTGVDGTEFTHQVNGQPIYIDGAWAKLNTHVWDRNANISGKLILPDGNDIAADPVISSGVLSRTTNFGTYY
jgi:hypothetical protein